MSRPTVNAKHARPTVMAEHARPIIKAECTPANRHGRACPAHPRFIVRSTDDRDKPHPNRPGHDRKTDA
jgi:hypothetical protein